MNVGWQKKKRYSKSSLGVYIVWNIYQYGLRVLKVKMRPRMLVKKRKIGTQYPVKECAWIGTFSISELRRKGSENEAMNVCWLGCTCTLSPPVNQNMHRHQGAEVCDHYSLLFSTQHNKRMKKKVWGDENLSPVWEVPE